MVKKVFIITAIMFNFSCIAMEIVPTQKKDYLSTLPDELIQKYIFPQLITSSPTFDDARRNILAFGLTSQRMYTHLNSQNFIKKALDLLLITTHLNQAIQPRDKNKKLDKTDIALQLKISGTRRYIMLGYVLIGGIERNDSSLFTYALENGVDINFTSHFLRQTPIVWAIKSNNVEMVQALEKKDAHFLTLDSYGKNPLDLAIENFKNQKTKPDKDKADKIINIIKENKTFEALSKQTIKRLLRPLLEEK